MLETTILVLNAAARNLWNLLPYIIGGVLLSEILKHISWGKVLTGLATAAPLRTVIWAVFIGIISPMCTYGSLPIVLTLFSLGFPIAALVSFLVASSLMNPQLFIITWGGISPEMALVRLAAVAVFSLLFGFVIHHVDDKWIVNPGVHEAKKKQKADREFTWKRFLQNSWNALQFVGFYIVIGVLLGAVVEIAIPPNWFDQLFREPAWLGILISALLGIPLYACGGGTIPLIQAMLGKGLSFGAALAFFLVGPATRVTPLIALATIMRPRFIAIMIFLLLVFALAAGLIANIFIS